MTSPDPLIPRGQSPILPLRALRSPPAQRQGERPEVLLVDDDAVLATAFRRLQQQPGHPFTYRHVSSCATALAALREPDFDPALVLADYALGDGYGTDLVPLVPGTPVVIMTGLGSETVAVQALRAGAADYLIKDTQGAFLELVAPTIERTLARHRAEDEARRRKVELEFAQQDNRSLERFASMVATSLTTPIQMLAHYCGLLLSHGTIASDRLASSYASAATSGARRAQTLIADILEYSRITAVFAPEPAVDLADTLHAAIASLQTTIDAIGTRLQIGDLPTLAVDPRQLRALWTRLLQSLLDRPVRPRHLAIGSTQVGDVWRIELRSDGGGEAAEGDPLDERSIGLALCRRIAERHGGTLQVAALAGRGTTITVTLRGAAPFLDD